MSVGKQAVRMSSQKDMMEALGCENEEELANIFQTIVDESQNGNTQVENEITPSLAEKLFEPFSPDKSEDDDEISPSLAQRLFEPFSSQQSDKCEEEISHCSAEQNGETQPFSPKLDSEVTFSQAERLLDHDSEETVGIHFSDISSLPSEEMHSFNEWLDRYEEEQPKKVDEGFISDFLSDNENTSSPKSESLLQPLTHIVENISSAEPSPCKSSASSDNLWDSDESIVSIYYFNQTKKKSLKSISKLYNI